MPNSKSKLHLSNWPGKKFFQNHTMPLGNGQNERCKAKILPNEYFAIRYVHSYVKVAIKFNESNDPRVI